MTRHQHKTTTPGNPFTGILSKSQTVISAKSEAVTKKAKLVASDKTRLEYAFRPNGSARKVTIHGVVKVGAKRLGPNKKPLPPHTTSLHDRATANTEVIQGFVSAMPLIVKKNIIVNSMKPGSIMTTIEMAATPEVMEMLQSVGEIQFSDNTSGEILIVEVAGTPTKALGPIVQLMYFGSTFFQLEEVLDQEQQVIETLAPHGSMTVAGRSEGAKGRVMEITGMPSNMFVESLTVLDNPVEGRASLGPITFKNAYFANRKGENKRHRKGVHLESAKAAAAAAAEASRKNTSTTTAKKGDDGDDEKSDTSEKKRKLDDK